MSDFYFIDIIRFVCSLAFQRRILNCSTAKTREDTAKRKRKVESDGWGGGYDEMSRAGGEEPRPDPSGRGPREITFI